MQPKFTRVEGVGIVMQSSPVLGLHISGNRVNQDLTQVLVMCVALKYCLRLV
jgi:hypothetical protein